MVKVNNKVLKKFDKDLDLVFNEIDQFENDVITTNKNKLQELEQELVLKNKEIEDMKITGINDTSKFLNIRNDIKLLENNITELKDVLDFNDTMLEEYMEGKFDNLYQKYFSDGTDDDFYKEYKDNMLVLQKEMFKKFLEIEELCNQMDLLSDDYNSVVKRLPHSKLKYLNIDSYTYKNKVHQRFNLNRFVKYYTGITTEKENFEY